MTVLGMAHITGGGITGNVPRSLPDGVTAVVDRSAWDVPPVFRTICAAARLPDEEAFRTFNMGIGMVLMLPARGRGPGGRPFPARRRSGRRHRRDPEGAPPRAERDLTRGVTR